MTQTVVHPSVPALNRYNLLDAASTLENHATNVSDILGEDDTYFGLTARHLRALAQKKFEYDVEQNKIAIAKAKAEAEEQARIEALTQALMTNMTVVGSKRVQAVKLLEQFDITPKATTTE